MMQQHLSGRAAFDRGKRVSSIRFGDLVSVSEQSFLIGDFRREALNRVLSCGHASVNFSTGYDVINIARRKRK